MKNDKYLCKRKSETINMANDLNNSSALRDGKSLVFIMTELQCKASSEKVHVNVLPVQ